MKGFLVTAKELHDEPWKYEAKMRSLVNIALWRKHYHGKRVVDGIQLKPIRDRLDQIEKEIKQTQKNTAHKKKKLEEQKTKEIKQIQKDAAQKKKKFEEQKIKEKKQADSYAEFHEHILQAHHALEDKRSRFIERGIIKNTAEYHRFMRKASRAIGNRIHDTNPNIKLGIQTFRCWNKKQVTPKFKPTEEHFWPRSVIGGRDLLEQCLVMGDKFDIRCTIRTLFQLCQTVECLPEENTALRDYQKADKFIDPQTSYDDAGIRLIRVASFDVPLKWKKIFEEYNISDIPPYEFSGVMTTEEADEMQKSLTLNAFHRIVA